MTLEIEFWALVGLFVSFLSFVGGIARWLFTKTEARQAAHFSSLETALQHSVTHWNKLEKDFMRFQADLPLHYVRREDYIRGQTVIESKLDALYDKLDRVQHRPMPGSQHTGGQHHG